MKNLLLKKIIKVNFNNGRENNSHFFRLTAIYECNNLCNLLKRKAKQRHAIIDVYIRPSICAIKKGPHISSVRRSISADSVFVCRASVCIYIKWVWMTNFEKYRGERLDAHREIY